MSSDHEARVVEFSEQLGLSLDDEALARLRTYLQLLTTWNQRVRLTGSTDPAELWLRHVCDCLAVASRVEQSDRFVDIGSGAGFPGVVMAIAHTGLSGVLIEPRRRRASFLSEVLRTVGCAGKVEVACLRAEEFAVAHPEARFAVAVSRAVRLEDFARHAIPLLEETGRAIGMDASTGEPPPLPGFSGATSVTYELPIGVRRRLLLYDRLC